MRISSIAAGKTDLEETTSPAGVRTRGLILVIIGAVIGSALFGLTLLASRTFLLQALIMLTAFPALVFLIGLLELITGISFGRLAKTWSRAPQPIQIALTVLVVIALLAAVAHIFQLGLKAATPS